MFFVVLSVTVYTVGYSCSFYGDQIFVNFVGFLSMIIYNIFMKFYIHDVLSIKTSGSESRGQEEAASTCIFKPMRPLQ